MKEQRPGYKKSLVMKSGIKIDPIGVAQPGNICYHFKIEVSKTGKDGKVRKVKTKDSEKRYPDKGTKDKPSVWEKIEEIYDYYYNKLTKAL
jgi:hypothetical protein